MRKTNFAGIAALLTAFAVWAVPGSASATGDIRSIEAVSPASANYGDPLQVGQEFKFKIRFLNRISADATPQMYNTTSYNPWMFKLESTVDWGHSETWTNLIAGIYNPAIAVWVGDHVDYATIDMNGVDYDTYHTEFTCTYTVKPGDIAMPILLANSTLTGPAKATDGGPYYIRYGEYFNLYPKDRYDAAYRADVSFGAAALSGTPGDEYPATWNMASETRDTDLSQAGVCARTIDFASNYDDEDIAADPRIWRRIRAKSTTPVSAIPSLDLTQVGDVACTVYLWTDYSATIPGVDVVGTTRTGVHDVDGTVVASRTVYELNTVNGANFTLKGIDSGYTNTLYLSTSPDFQFNPYTGALITNFVTRKVASAPPLPPYITVTLDGVASKSVAAGTNYAESVCALTVTLSAPYTNAPLDVYVSPAMLSGTSDPYDYIGVANTYNVGNEFSDKVKKVTFTQDDLNDGIVSKTLYVYALKSDGESNGPGKGIKFTPNVIDLAAAAYYSGNANNVSATLSVTSVDPVVAPERTTYTDLLGGVDSEFVLQIFDAYAQATNKFDIYWVKNSSSEPSRSTMTKNKVATGVTLSTVSGIPSAATVNVRYSGGTTYKSWVMVEDSAGRYSSVVPISVQVNEAKKAWVEVVDRDISDPFGEGETLKLRFHLTEPAEDNVYAFLVPANEVSTNSVTCKAFATGQAILSGATNSTSTVDMFLKDGNDDTQPLEYDIVFRSKNKLTEGDEDLLDFEKMRLELYVTNVAPRVTSVGMSSSLPVTTDGGKFSSAAAVGLKKIFTLEGVADVDVDTATNIVAQWTFAREGGSAQTYTTTGPADVVALTNTFNVAGSYTCKVKLQDKDMDGKQYGPEFTFYLNVTKEPMIDIQFASSNHFDEREVMDGGSSFNVKLEPAPPVDVEVQVTVTRVGTDGILSIKAGSDPSVSSNTYTYTSALEVSGLDVDIVELDGTYESKMTAGGFMIEAKVVSGTLNEEGVAYSNVYKVATTKAYVDNAAPVFLMPDASGVTNNAAIGVPVVTHWRVEDIDIDMASNITVSVTTSEGASDTIVAKPDAGKHYVEGWYTNYFTSGGSKKISFQAVDKDEAPMSETREVFFYVAPSKGVYLYPQGPFSGGPQSDLSKAYVNSADGLGSGRMYADGAKGVVDSFRHLWTYDVGKVTANVYAQGYKAGAKDDGSIGSHDIGIDASGDNSGLPIVTYFENGSAYDSFFYAWILSTKEEGAALATGTALIAPSSGERTYSLGLPTEVAGDDDNPYYEDRYVEAIFAREFKLSDNMGDINQDGVPDVYAAREWKGGILYELMEVQLSAPDLTKVSAYNGDEDRLPNAWRYADPLNPSIPGWGPGEGDSFNFTADLEIRGFGNGLNEPGISDWDLDSNEQFALLADFFSAGNAWQVTTNIVDNGDGTATTNFVTETDLTVSNAYSWAESRGWSCERRMDPTVADTDEDGLDDAWEYFFWYYATAGRVYNGNWARMTGSRFSLEKFGEDGADIPSWAIASAFDPTSKRSASTVAIARNPYTGATWTYNTRDFDRDGLLDLEEYVLGTNPVHWDSDGDGISDFWEVINGLDPLDKIDGDRSLSVTDLRNNPDGDFMARANLSGWTVASFTNGVIFAVGVQNALALSAGDTQQVFAVELSNNSFKDAYVAASPLPSIYNNMLLVDAVAWKKFTYEGAEYLGEQIVLKAGTRFAKAVDLTAAPIEVPYAMMSNGSWRLWDADLNKLVATNHTVELFRYGLKSKDMLVPKGLTLAYTKNMTPHYKHPVFSVTSRSISILHSQVLEEYGFDPRTGWNLDEYGYVGPRWHAEDSSGSTSGVGGISVNTAPYTSLDEYLLLRYRYEVGTGSFAPDEERRNSYSADLAEWESGAVPILTIFARSTTLPNVAYELGEGADEVTGVSAYYEKHGQVHGADTDVDGIPDGWELYVRADPNNEADSSFKDIDDGDRLTLLEEFAGTDSCGAYTNCESIAVHGPWNADSKNKGWYNKFFPTSPYDIDTDGDGINDNLERAGRTGFFYVGRNEYLAKLTFIYGPNGVPEKDTGGFCIAGGGLNPCTVDTDRDQLPDAWEFEFAGIVVSNGAVEESVAMTEADLAAIKMPDGYSSEYKDSDICIRGGMDGTVKDANFDYDHDGLLNFQEYLVQSLRHLRYDDSETPLMGRHLFEGKTETYRKFVRMQAFDGESFYDTVRAAGYGATSAFKFRELGYFALPPKEWDPVRSMGNFSGVCHSKAEGGYRYMFRPYALTRNSTKTKEVRFESSAVDGSGYFNAADFCMYATTDPRKWDSDGDGMDDYYELFHGLNPLLGSSAAPNGYDDHGTPNIRQYDRIAMIYCKGMSLSEINAWENAWTGWGKTVDFGKAPTEMFDAMKYPWMMGTAEADADGDGIRNVDEALMVNVTAPRPSHTDPTPLWMTDSTNPEGASYVWQYYAVPLVPGATSSELLYYDSWIWRQNLSISTELNGSDIYGETTDGANRAWMFSFEENEGYDTDRDSLRDSAEMTKTVNAASDPLVYSDPDRRQALWFGGAAVPSAAISYSGSLQRSFSTQYDLLRQFTVECWIKPESKADQVIVERVSDYGASTLSNNVHAIRANFRIGIEGGRLYGEFEGSAADSGSVRVVGGDVATNQWTHVALTMDGSTLALYENGGFVPVAKAMQIKLVPANGITILRQEAGTSDNGMLNDHSGTISSSEFMTVVQYGYRSQPCVMVLGARAADVSAFNLSAQSWSKTFSDLYCGYVDELRVWDGARTAAEIDADYRKRYTMDDVKAMRNDIYARWANGARRNDTGTLVLPAELVQHYNFQSLPGARDPDLVIEGGSPLLFQEKVLDNVRWNGSDISPWLYCGWWNDASLKSSVYWDYHVVPWIQNTCAHLPPMDGSTIDSQYWSENFAGVRSALESGVSSFVFPNTANPYPYYKFLLDKYLHALRLFDLGVSNDVNVAYFNLYKFEMRSGFVGTSDLVPLGGAFAKRGVDFWDGDGPMDVWTSTARDSNGDGLPDWWIAYAATSTVYGASATAISSVDDAVVRSNVKMPAWKAYWYDLAEGMAPFYDPVADDVAATIVSGFRLSADGDGNGILDWWEKFNGIAGETVRGDHDNDQLSNFMEYLIGECFTHYPEFAERNVQPTEAYTYAYEKGQKVPDYYLPVGRLYLGEMFADHDFIEDWWEDLHSANFASRFSYDATRDSDDDGWSNYAECRHSLWKSGLLADGHDVLVSSDAGYVAEHPEPALVVKMSYNGAQAVEGKGFVVKVTPSDKPAFQPAVFKVAGGGTDGSASKVESVVGVYPYTGKIHGHLHPGSVAVDGCLFYSAELSSGDNYIWNYNWYGDYYNINLSYGGAKEGYGVGSLAEYLAERTRYPHIELEDASVSWKSFAVARADSSLRYGSIIFAGETSTNGSATASSGTVGSIDFATGEYEIDMDAVADMHGSTSDLEMSAFKVEYAYAIPKQYPLTVSLSKPDSGTVIEGPSTVEAFIDVDGNGEWTFGEPYGCVQSVEVGWWKTPVDIALTDASPQFVRVSAGASGSSSSSSSEDTSTDLSTAAESSKVKVNVTRLMLSGQNVGSSVSTAPNEVFSATIDLSRDSMVSEKLLADSLDIDWGTIVKKWKLMNTTDANATRLTNAVYGVNLRSGTGQTLDQTYTFTKRFEYGAAQALAEPLSPKGSVYAARPTFQWKHSNTLDKAYPAFQLRVWNKAKTALVYDSGPLKAPPRSASGVYSWTAPISVDMFTPRGVMFANTNNYCWTVSMLDAKFTAPNSNEVAAEFRMECSGAGGAVSDYGSLDVAVRYFGPSAGDIVNNATAYLLRVQAFDTPDFSGLPVAEATVTNLVAVTNWTDLAANATLKGLETPGTYYVRSFVDANGNGVRDAWETWGYANFVGSAEKCVYNPRPVVFGNSSAALATVVVFMEDADTDNDGLPDMWEVKENGSIDAKSSPTGNTYFTKVNTNLTSTVAAFTKLDLSAGSSPSTPALRLMSVAPADDTLAFAALVGGYSSFAAMDAAITPEIAENGVSITAVTFEGNGELTINWAVESTVAATADGGLFATSKTVDLPYFLKFKASLSDSAWTTVYSGTLTIDGTVSSGSATFDLSSALEEAGIEGGASAGFFTLSVGE